jgi:hypothetical protein
LVQLADWAQQELSSENASALQNALPAPQALHKAWAKRLEKVKKAHTKYISFVDAPKAGFAEI